MHNTMETFFELKKNKTDVRTEVIAGITTFLTMAYILVVQPLTLAEAGMDFGAVFTATAIASFIGTMVMALVAKLPFALAPGMGLNAFFAFSVVVGMGRSWQFALTAVFLEGIIFIILTMLNVREAIVDSIPENIKKAISVGIGLFIAFVGFKNAGIIVAHEQTLVQLGSMAEPGVLVALIGLIGTGAFVALKMKGALLVGILAATVIGIPFGITTVREGFQLISAPPSIAPVFMQFEWGQIFTFDMLLVVFTFLFVDMFDTVGTLVGVSTKAGLMTKDGKIPRVKGALMADAIGTTAGAMLGTSTVTTYIESAAGVEEGGRTGLTALVTACFFLVALFFSQVFLLIPAAATAPALILVGVFMASPVKDIDFTDYTEAIPAFLTLIVMPLTFSISEGIVFGVLSYVFLKLLTGRHKEITLLTYLVGVFFLISLVV
ncbi:putative MFS transporter, AGZA family, xanthine/uracil permease [Alkalispirochaeta americana]|uniref:Putative MFS transporter, AGZA family, xanthine/uracil permease n=2 Tax=Alkalispirochaeta americana TaxID=159291 RepID=A0A1N6TE74_9SPIO|nr:putative MFS transporter, AGZA family, xanthine/uracil permease [Alkalispirochaeta americana]